MTTTAQAAHYSEQRQQVFIRLNGFTVMTCHGAPPLKKIPTIRRDACSLRSYLCNDPTTNHNLANAAENTDGN